MEDLVLNEYENMVALEVVAPEDIPVGFAGEYFEEVPAMYCGFVAN